MFPLAMFSLLKCAPTYKQSQSVNSLYQRTYFIGNTLYNWNIYYNIYNRLSNIIRAIKYITLRWTGHVARMKESSDTFKILKGKPIGKRSISMKA